MIISKSTWEKLTDLWNISEIASTVSRALASLYIVKTGLHRTEIDIKTVSYNIEKCREVLERILTELELYMNKKAPETELVTLVINAYGDVDTNKILRHVRMAINGIEKVIEALSEETLNMKLFKDADVVKLEDLLKRLSDVVSKKVEQMANEIYAF